VLGASTSQVAAQQGIEAALTLILASVLALAAIILINPWFRTSQYVDLLYVWRNGSAFWQHVALTITITALITGILPSLAAIKVHARAALERSRGGAAALSSRWLVGAQFMLSGVLTVFVLVVRWQQHEMTAYAQSTLPAPIVAINNNLKLAGVDFNVLRAELLKQPHIQAVSSTGYTPWGQTYALSPVANSREAGSMEVSVINEPVGEGYFAVMELKFLAGSGFSDSSRSDGAARSAYPIVIGNRLAQLLGWPSATMAIGKLIYPGQALRDSGNRSVFRVIGVVEDRTMRFTTEGAQATLYTSSSSAASTPLVRVARDHVGEGFESILKVWRSLSPNTLVRAQFLDDVVREYVESKAATTNLLSAVTLLALMIALAGLLGMTIHMVTHRMHEIGIRKTIGARTAQIVTLLLKDIARPIVIGSIVGWPLAYWMSQKYLSIYLHRIELSPLPFVLALTGTIAIALSAIGWHTARTARLKPADVLRHE